jgi:type I restriction enzyme R subunit
VLEAALHWQFERDRGLSRPYEDRLGAMLHEPSLRATLPPNVYLKAMAVYRAGNAAAHRGAPVAGRDAVRAVEELFHFLYWLSRTYSPDARQHPAAHFDAAFIPAGAATELEDTRLRALQADFEARLQASAAALDARATEHAATAEALKAAQAALVALKAKNQAVPDTHNYNEAETRKYLIDVLLAESGWPVGALAHEGHDTEYEVAGMPNAQNKGFVDYVLWGEDGVPLALVEAKRTHHDAAKGHHQAKLYADCLEAKFGRRPVIYLTNGYEHWMWDDATGPRRRVAGFYTRDELALLHARRRSARPGADLTIDAHIVERAYQHEAIRRVCEHLEAGHRRALVVMATGTGKTRTTVALVDLLIRAERVRRVLFLADRRPLIRQARRAFKTFLPRCTTVDLLDDPAGEGHVYLCTYHTMLNLVDDLDEHGRRRFGPGFFDLVVADEAHRSVYKKFGDLFDWFDGPLLGLTATPRDEIHRDTWKRFELEQGTPTFAYDLATAIAEKYLVPPKARTPQFRFLREGITHAQLSPEEQEEYEEKFIDAETLELPARIEPRALNEWVFNHDTIDKAIDWVLENGLRVDEGTRLGKTIVFCRSHKHARLVEERFNARHPDAPSRFALVIDSHDDYAHTLLTDFEKPNAQPTIALSVDMLDTGIDVPEVVNLVFFRAVASKTKYHQMIGRGTRLCQGLLGPGQDKTKFLVIDLCGNVEFFGNALAEDNAPLAASIVERVLERRATLATLLGPDDAELKGTLLTHLHAHVAGMDAQKFQVRAKVEIVERLGDRAAWDALSADDLEADAREVGPLPTSTDEGEHVTARRFDLLIVNLQIALLRNEKRFEALRKELVEQLAGLRDRAESLPMIAARKAVLDDVLGEPFWAGCTVHRLEKVRLALRDIAKFYQPKPRRVVETETIVDGLMEEVAPEFDLPLPAPTFDTERYRRKVEACLKANLDHIAVAKLRHARPLTPADIAALETLLTSPEAAGDRATLDRLAADAPLALFVRRLVGLDRGQAQAALDGFVGTRNWTAGQLRFLTLIVDYLTRNGVMAVTALYEPPFDGLHPQGLDGLFDPETGDNIVAFVRRVNDSAVTMADEEAV